MGAMTRPASPADPYTADDLRSMVGGRRHELVDGALIVTGEPALTIEDLDRVPDDGRRYELIDGNLIVTPSPSRRHQRGAARLLLLLSASCPEDLEVLAAPFDVQLPDHTHVQPDILVTPASETDERSLHGPPILAVEILSPSTRLIDLHLKKARYESAGCQHCWIVDPTLPSVTAWTLIDGAYFHLAYAEGDDELVIEQPFPVSITPNRLFYGPNLTR